MACDSDRMICMSSDGYIGNLGRQDSDPSLLTLALCIILPGGLFVLAGLVLLRYLKG
jgi:hypothetical protein